MARRHHEHQALDSALEAAIRHNRVVCAVHDRAPQLGLGSWLRLLDPAVRVGRARGRDVPW